jgi:hypothetical protein
LDHSEKVRSIIAAKVGIAPAAPKKHALERKEDIGLVSPDVRFFG